MAITNRFGLKKKLNKSIYKNGRLQVTAKKVESLMQDVFDSHFNKADEADTGGVNADWTATSGPAQILNKPSTFTPSAHTHAISAITGLQPELDSKGNLDGVSAEGNTLKKLYDLIIAGFSEIPLPNIAARDAYEIIKLPTNVFVEDDGDGNWACYKATSLGVGANYVKLSDPDLLNAVQTAAQIKAAYESNSNTNAFTDLLKSLIDSMPTDRILGRKTAGVGLAEFLTGTQVTEMLDTFTSLVKGIVPPSGGGTIKFLRADGVWHSPAKIYLNDAVQSGQFTRRYYTLTISGSNGEVAKYMTSDGLTKTGSNTFLFTTILAAGGNSVTIGSDTECDLQSGVDLSEVASSGLVRWRFSESNTTGLGGGEGLQDTENGTTVTVWIDGIE